MTRLLLDYPWALADGFGPDPVPQNVVLAFLNLLAKTRLDAVAFVGPEEYAAFCTTKNPQHNNRGRRNSFAILDRFIRHCLIKKSGGLCRAAPVQEPQRLRDSWKRALREEMSELSAWRSPQIIVPEQRRADWPPGDEVGLNCEECGDVPASGPHQRVLAVLEQYESHPFAVSDLNPWDLQRIHPPVPDRPRQHPALLPKPLSLNGVSLIELYDQLGDQRAKGWVINKMYYFIPPKDFNPFDIDKETWRKGRAFRYETASDSNRSGPVDDKGVVWSWDEEERHWDVQTKPTYMRISHTGERLSDPS